MTFMRNGGHATHSAKPSILHSAWVWLEFQTAHFWTGSHKTVHWGEHLWCLLQWVVEFRAPKEFLLSWMEPCNWCSSIILLGLQPEQNLRCASVSPCTVRRLAGAQCTSAVSPQPLEHPPSSLTFQCTKSATTQCFCSGAISALSSSLLVSMVHVYIEVSKFSNPTHRPPGNPQRRKYYLQKVTNVLQVCSLQGVDYSWGTRLPGKAQVQSVVITMAVATRIVWLINRISTFTDGHTTVSREIVAEVGRGIRQF